LNEVRQLADMFESKPPEYISEKLKAIQGMIDAFFVDVLVDEDNLRIATQEKRVLEGEVLKLQENYQVYHCQHCLSHSLIIFLKILTDKTATQTL